MKKGAVMSRADRMRMEIEAGKARKAAAAAAAASAAAEGGSHGGTVSVAIETVVGEIERGREAACAKKGAVDAEESESGVAAKPISARRLGSGGSGKTLSRREQMMAEIEAGRAKKAFAATRAFQCDGDDGSGKARETQDMVSRGVDVAGEVVAKRTEIGGIASQGLSRRERAMKEITEGKARKAAEAQAETERRAGIGGEGGGDVMDDDSDADTIEPAGEEVMSQVPEPVSAQFGEYEDDDDDSDTSTLEPESGDFGGEVPAFLPQTFRCDDSNGAKKSKNDNRQPKSGLESRRDASESEAGRFSRRSGTGEASAEANLTEAKTVGTGGASESVGCSSAPQPPPPGEFDGSDEEGMFVTIDASHEVRVERDRLEREDHNRQWEISSYPKLNSATACFDDRTAIEIDLSSLPPNRRRPRPEGVLPARISRFLSPYQRTGVTFLYRLFERDRGGICADDMGTGKTMQMICFLGAAFGVWDRDRGEKAKSARILISLPSSLVTTWERAIDTWTPFRVRQFFTDSGLSVRKDIKNDDVDIVLITHGILRTDMVQTDSRLNPNRILAKVKWNVLAVDEIHEAKSDKTQIYKAFDCVKATCKFGMTGTAIQNKLKEAFCLLELVVGSNANWPGKSFCRRTYGNAIQQGMSKDASAFQRDRANTARAELRKLMGKHMLRRTKAVIADRIPAKTDSGVMVRLPPHLLQGRMYRNFINSYDCYMLRNSRVPCSCGSGNLSRVCCHRYPITAKAIEKSPIWRARHPDGKECEKCPNCLMLIVMHVGMAIVSHALALLPEDEKSIPTEQLEFRRGLVEFYSEGQVSQKSAVEALENDLGMSAKLDVAMALLKKWGDSHKTIIFFESLRMGAILMRWATSAGKKFANIDGRVSSAARQAQVDMFQTDSFCRLFFVSKKAGSTGLNITAADRVLIFEPNWNPTFDLQSQDRAHRLGQKRIVKVYRMIVQDTIEAYQFKTQLVKNQLANSVIDDLDEEPLFSSSEVKSMAAMLAIKPDFVKTKKKADYDENRKPASSTDVELDWDIEENIEEIMESGMRDHSVFSGKNDCLLGGGDIEDLNVDVDVDPEVVSFRKPALRGLDSDDDDDSSSESEDDEGARDAPAAPAFAADDDVPGPEINETQDVDALLMVHNADSRCMLTTNEAKHRNRPALMKRGKKDGGLNGAVGAVEALDLDTPLEHGDGDGQVGLGMEIGGAALRWPSREEPLSKKANTASYHSDAKLEPPIPEQGAIVLEKGVLVPEKGVLVEKKPRGLKRERPKPAPKENVEKPAKKKPATKSKATKAKSKTCGASAGLFASRRR